MTSGNRKRTDIHKGHRGRLKARYKKQGLDGFDEHVVLELLLFFGIPYKDTNEIAHELINKFGSISGVFNADIESLKDVKNMTENAAILLHLIPELSKLYHLDNSENNKTVVTLKNIKRFLLREYIGVTEEIVYLLLFDKNNVLIDRVKVNEGSKKISSVSIGKVVKTANVRNVTRVALCHNHPDNAPISTNDIITTKQLMFHLKGVEIELLESFVVTKGRVIGILDMLESKM